MLVSVIVTPRFEMVVDLPQTETLTVIWRALVTRTKVGLRNDRMMQFCTDYL